ncbi:MAG: 2-oxoglutarate dehydrogenase complex dihydrolipoyllysine-residue succinyltransferase [Acidobacteriota bacterium]
MAHELKIPQSGESITEVEIGEWLVQEGEFVAVDEPVVVIETDKASMELPAPVSGTLAKILVAEGDEAAVGDVIGVMEEGEAAESKGSAEAPAAAAAPAEAAAPEAAASEATDEDARVMPAARRLLDEHGLAASAVKATGPGGRLLKEDVQRHLESSSSGAAPAPAAKPAPAPAAKPAPAATGPRQEERVKLSRLRRTIATRLVEAQQNAALLTTFNEVDMSAVMALRKKYQPEFVEKYGRKVGFMSFFVKAVIEGLKEIPGLNAEIRLEDREVIYRNYYDIGIAVGGGRGLVVPVIRNAERLSFAEIEATITELAVKARDNELEPEDLEGGTFTISNGGIYGSMLSTPIVNPPQSGILGMHNIVERPVAVNGEVVIRPIMYLALSYDHRIVDGREAVTFLVRVKKAIEDPARLLLEV